MRFLPSPHLLESPRGRLPAAALPHRTDPLPACVEVVIVGGGPAGLAVASALWHAGVRDIAVLDAGSRPCGRFLDRMDQLDQRVLRSPYEHHPGVEGYRDCELLDFARLHWGLLTTTEREQIRMAQSGHRSVVPVDLFAAFTEHVAEAHDLPAHSWQARVSTVHPGDAGVDVDTDRGRVRAGHVVLCLGEERRAAPEGWWEQQPRTVGYWDEPVPVDIASEVVVGAGLSAAHRVAGALAAGHGVAWVMRETGERYQCADVDASFFRVEGRAKFTGTPWSERLRLMAGHRRASIMFEFRPGLAAAEAQGRLTVHRGALVDVVEEDGVRLADGRLIRGEHVTLCLGTVPSIGVGVLPDAAVGAVDGWPDLDNPTLAYRHAPRVLTVGAAAGMAFGPAARNLDGHRVATARVVTTIASSLDPARLPRAAAYV